ncbi:MAG: hypothetical protein JNL10_01185 [Verrucomicrobiales bacterium]|nr:hypothetical protein [Verrucomicrobiales bacterium]
MSTFATQWDRLWQRIKSSGRELPSSYRIPPSQTDLPAELRGPFVPGEHYFEVRVNELFLTASRKWLAELDPLVVVVAEFTYDREERTLPFLVGPALVKKLGAQAPQGMLLQNTRVAGLHPYRGGRLGLTVVLCESRVKDHGRELLELIEGTAAAFGAAAALGAYLKVARVILDGVDSFLGFGETVPLAGLRTEFDSDQSHPLTPGYFVLINRPDVDPATLWVREGQLLQGTSAATARPYRGADFVLYSVMRPADNERDDLTTLPFYPLWERVQAEAAHPSEEHFKSAKVNLAALYQAMVASPDLNPTQADTLIDRYAARMKAIHERAVGLSTLGASHPPATATNPATPAPNHVLSRSLSLLNDP